MTDEAQFAEEMPVEASEPETVQYVEFVGTPPYGTEFYGPNGTHSVTEHHMKLHHDVVLGQEEVVWKKGSNGRFLVPASSMTPEAVAVLVADPMFQAVEL